LVLYIGIQETPFGRLLHQLGVHVLWNAVILINGAFDELDFECPGLWIELVPVV
jgi:hypothetical protein